MSLNDNQNNNNTNTNTNNDQVPKKSTGQYHSVKGTVVETVGNLTGSKNWSESGKQEHRRGEAEITAAQAKGYVDGTIDRAEGKLDSVTGAIKGDKQQQASGNIQEERGSAQQNLNK